MQKNILLILSLTIGVFMMGSYTHQTKQINNNYQPEQRKVLKKDKPKNNIEVQEKKDKHNRTKKSISNSLKINSLTLYSDYTKYLNDKPPELLSKFVFKGSKGEKTITLTFDDGPTPNTPKLIKLLTRYQVPATFFTICKKVNSKNSLIYNSKLITLGFHTYEHKNYDKFNQKQIFDDVQKCMDIYEKHNLQTKYFRPAYGVINKNLSVALTKNNLQGVLWSIDSHDWFGYKNQKLVDQVINNLTTDDIILFHDSVSVADIERIIILARKKGYHFISLDETLNR